VDVHFDFTGASDDHIGVYVNGKGPGHYLGSLMFYNDRWHYVPADERPGIRFERAVSGRADIAIGIIRSAIKVGTKRTRKRKAHDSPN